MTYMVMYIILQAECRKVPFVVCGTQALFSVEAGRAPGEDLSLGSDYLTVLYITIARNCWGWGEQFNL